MNCLICRQAETIDSLASVILEREEIKLVVKSVPAQTCPHCGEAYVNDAVAKRLLLIADEMVLTGEIHNVRDYE